MGAVPSSFAADLGFGAPSAPIIRARVILWSEAGVPPPEGNRMADIFAPPRLDFSLQEGWVRNADEDPLPEGVEMPA